MVLGLLASWVLGGLVIVAVAGSTVIVTALHGRRHLSRRALPR